MPKIEVKNREKLILAGLFLSKFDKKGVLSLGFSSFTEAFNVLGFAFGGKPMNIKNYRDEFDPFFNNSRKGWAFREMREHCKVIFEKFGNLNLADFLNLIKECLIPNFTLNAQIEKLAKQNENDIFIKRISTGLAAENFFIANFERYFNGFLLKDTRIFGCGFDFKLDLKNEFFCVEVKGLSEANGGFLLTQKEHEMAEFFKDRYCLFVVSNFNKMPKERLFFDPLSKFELKKSVKIIENISYHGVI